MCLHFQSITTNIMNAIPDRIETPVFIVVCPGSVLKHWTNEFKLWAPKMRACIFHSISKKFADVAHRGAAGIICF